jgi:hypothetical protein
MKWDNALRAIGVVGVVAAYAVFRFSDGAMNTVALGMIITAILGIVAPDVIDRMPWGPST